MTDLPCVAADLVTMMPSGTKWCPTRGEVGGKGLKEDADELLEAEAS